MLRKAAICYTMEKLTGKKGLNRESCIDQLKSLVSSSAMLGVVFANLS
jgi:hypothetical protein